MQQNVKKYLTYLGFLIGSAVVTYVAFIYIKDHISAFNVQKQSQDFSHTRVAVLDGERLKNSAKCFRAHDEISRKLNDILVNIKTAESEMKAQHNKINQNKELSAARKNKELGRLDARWTKLSDQYKAEIQSVNEAEFELTKRIQSEVDRVIEMIATKAGLKIILNKRTDNSCIVLFNMQNIDITDAVIQELDRTLPSVDIKIPQK